MFSRSWLAACGIVATGCALEVAEELDSLEAEVQHGFEDQGRYRLAKGTSEVLLGAVGTIRHAETISLSGYVPETANCGVTFVSPHFGITASHCVEGLVSNGHVHRRASRDPRVLSE